MTAVTGIKTFREKNINPSFPKTTKGIFKPFKVRTPTSFYESRSLQYNPQAGRTISVYNDKGQIDGSKFNTLSTKASVPSLITKEKLYESVKPDLLKRSFTNENLTTRKNPHDNQFLPPLILEKKDSSKKQQDILAKETLIEGPENAPKSSRPPALITGPSLATNKALFNTQQQSRSLIKAFAADTDMGLVRTYNEDRVSIIFNYQQPPNSIVAGKWPHISFFGLYDGHGGKLCADYLRDNLHNFVLTSEYFPDDPREALMEGFFKTEINFLKKASSNAENPDTSGSCANVVLIVGTTCYIANVGDSRAIMSSNSGRKVTDLSIDHKPENPEEARRIYQAGGRLYQSKVRDPKSDETSVGPQRVFPGRLSVTRTFGDIEAKQPRYGGNENVVICQPDIKEFKITDSDDFILIASDGIYDKLSSSDVVDTVWKHRRIPCDPFEECLFLVDGVMKEALERKTLDNISVVLISFKQIHLNWATCESPHKGKSINFRSQKLPHKEELKVIYQMFPTKEVESIVTQSLSANNTPVYLKKRPSRTFFFGDKKETDKLLEQIPKSPKKTESTFKRNIKSKKVPF